MSAHSSLDVPQKLRAPSLSRQRSADIPFLELAAAPDEATIALFQRCLTHKAKGMPATFKQNGIAYNKLQQFNGQQRTQQLMPLAFVEPESTADVSGAVQCAVSAGLRFTARNGAHSYEGNSLVHNGVVIDLRRMQDAVIQLRQQTLIAQGGCKMGPVFNLLFRHHLVLPGSNSVAVGLSGSTLGGGLTFMSRTLGMTADAVLAATVVLPNGTVVEANQDLHPDLFWAIRGGGPLYGIVTSWTFKLWPAPPRKPWLLSGQYPMVEFWCDSNIHQLKFYLLGTLQDNPNTTQTLLPYKTSGLRVWDQTQYSWPGFVVQEAMNLKPLTPPWGLANFTKEVLSQQEHAQDRTDFVSAVLMLNSTAATESLVALMAQHMANAPADAWVKCRALGGPGYAAVPTNHTAYPWRDAALMCQLYTVHSSHDDRTWLEGLPADVQAHQGVVAENYNHMRCAPDPWQRFFGRHASRLEKIKEAYDPHNRMLGLYCSAGFT
eukprot:gene13828-13947_t